VGHPLSRSSTRPILAYVREEVVVVDLDADLDEELAMLWQQYRQGGEA